MKTEKITNKADLLAFAKANPDWHLERCRGVRFYSWWWMRVSKGSPDTVHVDGRAASEKVLRDHFEVDRKASDEYGNTTVYRLKK